ncbi:MAG TPA: serine hydrolase domain-containing protein [Gemmatimonadaceae bacterium]|nr:serine hydrolase domain-containing protein [Gemmatimonadaceae bacterium]
MQQFVDHGTIAGAVTLLAHRGQIVSVNAVGYQDLELKIPMDARSIFQVRSMTKTLTATGIMILLEEGRLLLSDPVEKYVPEFRDVMVAVVREGDRVDSARKAMRPVTVYSLLTHTSGMSIGGLQAPQPTLARSAAAHAKRPLAFDPGDGFRYSDGGYAVLGRIIEVVAGEPYEEFIAARILRPLSMHDSFFFPPPEKCDRIASHYERTDGGLRRYRGYLNPQWNLREGCRAYVDSVPHAGPAWGLFSTAHDMAAFYQMMLNGGSYNGVRVISPASVEAMTTPHMGERVGGPNELPGPFLPRFHPFERPGLGWFIASDPRRLQPRGTYGHGGLRGTLGWVDPRNGVIGVLMIQMENEDGLDAPVRNTFIAMAYAALAVP